MTDARTLQADVIVVGGGPAGLSAATELRRLGVTSVAVLEREPTAGGIPRHCGHYPFGAREFKRVMKGPDYARRLVVAATGAGVSIHTGVTVTSIEPGPCLRLATPNGLTEARAKLVLLATGVRETSRAARLLGGTKPAGVMTTGTLQSMVYLERLRPFKRPVILGTELVSFSAIMTCRHLGIRPAAMIEPGLRTTARWPSGLFPALLGVPLHLGTELMSINGRDVVGSVTVTDPAGSREIECDGVIVSGRFRPDRAVLHGSHLGTDSATGGPEVDQYGRCSDPAFFAAGNMLRAVETAGWSWNEGRLIARTMTQALEGSLPEATTSRITLSGDALAYCVPQRLAASAPAMPLPGVQLRVNRAVKGKLVLRVNAEDQTPKSIDARPERRIILPYPDLPQDAQVEIRLEEST